MTIKELLTTSYKIQKMSDEPGHEWYKLSFEIDASDPDQLLDALLALRKEAGLPTSLWFAARHQNG